MNSQVPADRHEFDEQREAEEFLIQHLSARYPQSEWERVSFTEEVPLIEKIRVRAEKPQGEAASALVRRFRYVIRNEDLQLFDAVMDALVIAVSVGVFVVPGVNVLASWGAITAIVTKLLKVGRKAATKGVVLEKQHFAVLTTLHDAGESSFDELLERLRQQETDWSSERLQAALSLLQKAPSLDNSEVKLVISLPDQRWRTSGI